MKHWIHMTQRQIIVVCLLATVGTIGSCGADDLAPEYGNDASQGDVFDAGSSDSGSD
jgi:hypothetical protein